MQRVRFPTAKSLFEAFPEAGEDIAAPPTEEPPLTFARRLAAGETPEEAITFCAYLLPRREAVWWACRCVRALVPQPAGEEAAALAAAEDWVREPEDGRRRAALALGSAGDHGRPATWAALAAAWSGGSLVEGHTVPCPPHLTAKAAQTAVLTALAHVDAHERGGQLSACLETGLSLLTPEGERR